MPETTDKLIERLAHDAKPVKPVWPAPLRAGILIAGIVAAMSAFALYAGVYQMAIAKFDSAPFVMELGGAFLTGVSAVVAAVMLSVPGRAESWIYLPLPGVILWMLGGGIGCVRFVDAYGFSQSVFASQDCFTFIVTAGVPTAGAVYLLLRRAVSIHLLSVTALAGLGAAMFAATLLQFVHAHGTSPADFGAHAAAVITLMVFAIIAGRAALSRG